MTLLKTLADLAAFYAAHPRVSVLFFDTETTGKYNWRLPVADRTQPRIVQIACQLVDHDDRALGAAALLLRPADWTIPPAATAVHGWTDTDCQLYGVPAKVALATWGWLADSAGLLVAYNADFDIKLLQVEAERLGRGDPFGPDRPCVVFDPMPAATPICRLPKPHGHPTPAGDEYKWPTLAQAHEKLVGRPLDHAHDAGGDVAGLRRVFRSLRALALPSAAADLQSPISDLQSPRSP
jgi:DNA polymerase III epsilon subunit-like protein